ncbi:MAG: hypothetical protein ACREX9_20810, partial [Gammaproteobacteria bacterium]
MDKDITTSHFLEEDDFQAAKAICLRAIPLNAGMNKSIMTMRDWLPFIYALGGCIDASVSRATPN